MHLYIHIPFCRQACHYCDFHFSTSLKLKREIIIAICQEIKLQRDYLQHKQLDTIYFGGGTPSLLDEHDLALIFETIYQCFSVNEGAEITLEANPDDLTKDKIMLFQQFGINRLSIGIQSFNENHLKKINRIHTAQEAETCVKLSQDSGIHNLTVDLIYAIPSESHAIFENDLLKATNLGLNHISAYCLTIEPKTVFGKWLKQGKIEVINDEFASQQFEILVKHLADNGFEQYEISNFARNNQYARHNTSYWKQEEYLGVGPSAHSFNHQSRQYNISNNAQYLKSLEKGLVPTTIELLTNEDRINEYLLTGLRTKWGCDVEKLNQLLGNNFLDYQKDILAGQFVEKLIYLKDDTLLITEKGKLFVDRIASDLFIA
ncbi:MULTISPECIES: radical SAM family heme chaperone HemW [unclassified Arcicella]|uniref:radical SAM family heme chaperone HemW n=1 Tax=unclassified Arcicella TaxID=2644986 RepID=UPI002861234F|nr:MULTISPECIES: radical SAM family heme chaperone HemW [unclassified Arcicella]MDR6564781.1 oxygen-independent coproporphyrinogen-3 oxidase [Arcicella sp. BE51]MDR6814577.1 oxygen-independent coproporphyrinogen-3 oxidase [Arcicella sp. BE140]MDR6825955.1 oxygen-independent coproporphyrinogen-3 oxidase [Arcicella sp. BE139]